MKTQQQKRQEAKARNEAWAKLTPKQQLASLDKRGLVAKKQRARLQEKINEDSRK